MTTPTGTTIEQHEAALGRSFINENRFLESLQILQNFETDYYDLLSFMPQPDDTARCGQFVLSEDGSICEANSEKAPHDGYTTSINFGAQDGRMLWQINSVRRGIRFDQKVSESTTIQIGSDGVIDGVAVSMSAAGIRGDLRVLADTEVQETVNTLAIFLSCDAFLEYVGTKRRGIDFYRDKDAEFAEKMRGAHSTKTAADYQAFRKQLAKIGFLPTKFYPEVNLPS